MRGPTYEGPCEIDCPEKCEVPEGAVMTQVARPRLAWSDVLRCPNEGCGFAFLIEKKPAKEE